MTLRSIDMPHELLEELQTTIDREIPICSKMGIRVESLDERGLSMSAPLELNRNHQLTGFAGSLCALCTVTGWGMVFLVARQHGLAADVVIRRSGIKYLLPVDSEQIVATCTGVADAERAHFVEMFREKGQAKLDLRAEIQCGGQTAVSFHGSYVLLGKQ